MTSMPSSQPAVRVSGPAARATPPPRRLRASDADRTAAVARLQEAVARGLLTLDEGDERMAAAFAARYVDELAPLWADLPAPAPPAPPVLGWRRIGESVVDQLRHELQTTANSGPRSRRFAVSAAVVLFFVAMVLMTVGAVLHGLADPGHFQGPMFEHPR